ncbi:MAG: hypothetical protein ACUVXI_00080 [bacterium]
MGFEEDVKTLTDRLSCGEEQARGLLEYAGGDLDGAVELAGMDSVCAVKGSIVSADRRTQGNFVVIAETSRGNILRLGAAVTNRADFAPIDVKRAWNDFEGAFFSFRIGEGVDRYASNQIHMRFEEEIGGKERERFIDAARNGRLSDLKSIFAKLISDAGLHTEADGIGVSVDRISYIQFLAVSDEGGRFSPTKSAESQVEPAAMYQEIHIMLDPIKGRRLSELKAGDKILARYTDKTLDVSERLRTFEVAVESVERTDDNKWRVVSEIQGGVKGVTISDADVKVQLAEPEKTPEVPKGGERGRASIWSRLATVAIFVLIIAIVVLLVYIFSE